MRLVCFKAVTTAAGERTGGVTDWGFDGNKSVHFGRTKQM